ncbi:hypothetical protein [Microvirga sp. 3-52]|uniref:hypothetical protein n=1 Tax=Microvirga sp. 3-52 TaxID=2792425 RepID=UPI001BCDCE27|nr:hypothetical protein [Microvirga sp. 3-52]
MKLSPQLSAQESSAEPSAREAQKAACRRETNQIIAARRAHVRNCLAKGGGPG